MWADLCSACLARCRRVCAVPVLWSDRCDVLLLCQGLSPVCHRRVLCVGCLCACVCVSGVPLGAGARPIAAACRLNRAPGFCSGVLPCVLTSTGGSQPFASRPTRWQRFILSCASHIHSHGCALTPNLAWETTSLRPLAVISALRSGAYCRGGPALGAVGGFATPRAPAAPVAF